MDFSDHLTLSTAASAAIYLATGDPLAAAAFSATGIFIDLDHLIDYFRETGFNTDLSRFMGYFDGRQPRQLWLLLHAWEWALAALALCAALGAPAWAWSLSLGWLVHLVLDQRYNNLHPLAYWFFYRARLGFDAKPLFEWNEKSAQA